MIVSLWNVVRAVRGIFALNDVKRMWDAVDVNTKENILNVDVSSALVDNDWPGDAPRVPYIMNFLTGRSEVLDQRSRLCMFALWTLWMLIFPGAREDPRVGPHISDSESPKDARHSTRDMVTDHGWFLDWWRYGFAIDFGKDSASVPPAVIAKVLVRILKNRELRATKRAERKFKSGRELLSEAHQTGLARDLENQLHAPMEASSKRKRRHRIKGRMRKSIKHTRAKFRTRVLGGRGAEEHMSDEETAASTELGDDRDANKDIRETIRVKIFNTWGYEVEISSKNVESISFEKIRFLTDHEVDEQLSKLPVAAQDNLQWVDNDILQEWGVHIQLNREGRDTTSARMAICLGLPSRCSKLMGKWLDNPSFSLQAKIVAFTLILERHERPGDRPKLVSRRALQERMRYIVLMINQLLSIRGAHETTLINEILTGQNTAEDTENLRSRENIRDMLDGVLGQTWGEISDVEKALPTDAISEVKEVLRDLEDVLSDSDQVSALCTRGLRNNVKLAFGPLLLIAYKRE